MDDNDPRKDSFTPKERHGMKRWAADARAKERKERGPVIPVLGMTMNEFNELEHSEKRNVMTDALANMAMKWDSDSPDDQCYRSMIAAVNMIINTMFTVNAADVSEPMVKVVTQTYATLFQQLAILDVMKATMPQFFNDSED
jgi:hypothetical protein